MLSVFLTISCLLFFWPESNYTETHKIDLGANVKIDMSPIWLTDGTRRVLSSTLRSKANLTIAKLTAEIETVNELFGIDLHTRAASEAGNVLITTPWRSNVTSPSHCLCFKPLQE